MMNPTRKDGRSPRALPVVVLLALSGSAAAGCDPEPLEPGTEGCIFERSAVTECTVAVLEISGGIAGTSDVYVVRDDGTVKHIDRTTGAFEERVVPGGEARAARLADALDATHVREAEMGCYLPDAEVADGLAVRLTLHEEGRLWFFGSDCDSGPAALVEAVDLLEDYVQEAM